MDDALYGIQAFTTIFGGVWSLQRTRFAFYGERMSYLAGLRKKENMIDYRIAFESVPWERAMEGVRQRAVADCGKRLRLVEYSRAMPLHWCEKGHSGYILQGRLEIEFGEGVRIFEEGDGVFIPDGEKHKHRARVLSEIVRAVFVEDV